MALDLLGMLAGFSVGAVKSFLEVERLQQAQAQIPIETVILKLLAKHSEEQKKSLIIESPSNSFDALAPEGIDNLPGPCVIEIVRGRGDEYQVPETKLRQIASMLQSNQGTNLLLIVIATLKPKEKERITRIIKQNTDNILLNIWDRENVMSLVNKYAEAIYHIAPQLTSLAVNNIVEKTLSPNHDDWKNIRQQYISQLKEVYQKNQLVLFLGAGVSRSTNKLPDWDALLSKLFISLIESKLPPHLSVTPDEKQYLASQVHKTHNAFPLVEARYIRAGLENVFVEAVSKALYAGFEPDDNADSELLRSLAQLCVPKRRGTNIRAVVTYNFDDLLEKHLERLGLEHRAIYRDEDVASQEELPVYHVHGFLPQNSEPYEGIEDSLLVFSEEGYHTLFHDPYSWSNITQLNFLRESTCVMVGLSLTDPNLRRLLDIAARKSNSPKHYAFLKRDLSLLDKENNNQGPEVRREVVQAFNAVHHALQETAFQQLGVNIIWIEDYNEIPQFLSLLRNR